MKLNIPSLLPASAMRAGPAIFLAAVFALALLIACGPGSAPEPANPSDTGGPDTAPAAAISPGSEASSEGATQPAVSMDSASTAPGTSSGASQAAVQENQAGSATSSETPAKNPPTAAAVAD